MSFSFCYNAGIIGPILEMGKLRIREIFQAYEACQQLDWDDENPGLSILKPMAFQLHFLVKNHWMDLDLL